MLSFIKGLIAGIFFLLNLLFFPSILLVIAFFKFLIPIPAWRKYATYFMNNGIVSSWVDVNNLIIKLLLPVQWDIQGTGELSQEQWYFLISNHQSWVDILVLHKVFNRKIPVLKFFMKQELLWTLPFASWVCWALDFPFVKRYSKSYLKKYPEKRGQDFESTKRSSEKSKEVPSTIANYLEGTRFTLQKKEAQNSPYHHLLKPKAGGFALTLFSMKDFIHKLVNVTIAYPEGKCSFSDLVFGRIHRIVVRYEVSPIPPSFIGDYAKDKAFRTMFQQQLNLLWKEKDELIDQLIKKNTER